MYRIFILTVSLIALYFTFSHIGKYDSTISIELYNYTIKSKVFFIASLLMLTYILLMLSLKIFAVLLNLPTKVINLFSDYKAKRDNDSILSACNLLMADNKKEATNIAKKYLNHKNESIQKTAKMIMSRGLNNRDKVIYLQEILSYPELKLYANRSLAETLLNSGDYNNALMFATEAHNQDNNDIEALKILFDIYAKLQLWPKFTYILEKLNKLSPDFVTQRKQEITSIFFTAAKRSLEVGNDQETIDYLEQSLLYTPDFLPSINLLTELYNNLGKHGQICRILEKGFSFNPSYEIFEIYKTCTTKSPQELYDILAQEAEPTEHLGVFIKIASHLGLEGKLSELNNNMKLLK